MSAAKYLALAAACTALTAVVLYERHGSYTMLEQNVQQMDQTMEQRIIDDEKHLLADVRTQQSMLRQQSLRTYADGCSCECPSTGCDAEKHQGPVCNCPNEDAAMPEPFAPFTFNHDTARGSRVAPRRMQAARNPRQEGARMQKAWHLDDKINRNGIPLPPFFGSFSSPQAQPRPQARTQQKWVGSPQKFLPPDGDYPGGQTGIPLDGYLAYETGWANDGPFHGELAPMQEAGIASKAPKMSLYHHPRPRFQKHAAHKPKLGQDVMGDTFDDKVPASAVDDSLFAGAQTRSPTLSAFSDLV